MKAINFLHISDAHFQRKDEVEIKEISKKLIEDILKVEKKENIKIDLICFTGDLIQRGDKAMTDEKQWELAIDVLIKPLLDALNLSIEQVICVPGNHEVDSSKVVKVIENGLHVKTAECIDEMLSEFQTTYIDRLKYFYDNIREMQNDVLFGNLGYAFNREIQGINVGIACVDSAWRSSGKGPIERGNLYVGVRQIDELYSKIENAELKICMMHHPLDWLEECETLEMEKRLTNFNIVLRGHVHDEDDKQIIRQDMKTVYSTAGKLYPLDYSEDITMDGYNGYSIINVDMDNNFCNIFLRTYYGKNRKEFDEATNICEHGKKTYSLSFSNEDRMLEFNIVKGIKQKE